MERVKANNVELREEFYNRLYVYFIYYSNWNTQLFAGIKKYDATHKNTYNWDEKGLLLVLQIVHVK